jgi:hypothetical protein
VSMFVDVERVVGVPRAPLDGQRHDSGQPSRTCSRTQAVQPAGSRANTPLTASRRPARVGVWGARGSLVVVSRVSPGAPGVQEGQPGALAPLAAPPAAPRGQSGQPGARRQGQPSQPSGPPAGDDQLHAGAWSRETTPPSPWHHPAHHDGRRSQPLRSRQKAHALAAVVAAHPHVHRAHVDLAAVLPNQERSSGLRHARRPEASSEVVARVPLHVLAAQRTLLADAARHRVRAPGTVTSSARPTLRPVHAGTFRGATASGWPIFTARPDWYS